MLLADSYYGSKAQVAMAQAQGIDLKAPAPTPKERRACQLTLENFQWGQNDEVLLCPNGKRPASNSVATAKLQAKFDLKNC